MLYDPRIRSKSVHLYKFFQRGNIDILLILFRLLVVQCTWTFTKCFSLSSPLACAG